jgi:hypothetical protein
LLRVFVRAPTGQAAHHLAPRRKVHTRATSAAGDCTVVIGLQQPAINEDEEIFCTRYPGLAQPDERSRGATAQLFFPHLQCVVTALLSAWGDQTSPSVARRQCGKPRRECRAPWRVPSAELQPGHRSSRCNVVPRDLQSIDPRFSPAHGARLPRPCAYLAKIYHSVGTRPMVRRFAKAYAWGRVTKFTEFTVFSMASRSPSRHSARFRKSGALGENISDVRCKKPVLPRQWR